MQAAFLRGRPLMVRGIIQPRRSRDREERSA